MTTPAYHLPTFSGLPRWFACELPDVLGRVDESSEYSTAGTARHAFFQRITELLGSTPVDVREDTQPLDLAGARELALAEAPDEYREVLAAIPLESLGLHEVAAEVALVLNLETGEARELGRGLQRNYQGVDRTREIVGTIDRLGLIGADGLYIGDYKGRSHKTSPSQDPQFLAAALAASRIYGRSWVEIEVIRVIGDDVFPQRERVDVLDLDVFELRLQARATRAASNRAQVDDDPTGVPPATVGEHCSYCPSLRYCPAKMALARAALGGDSDELAAIAKDAKAYITEENAPRLRQLVVDAEKLLELVKEGLRDFARQTAFPLNDGTGRWYGVPPDATTRELTDGRKVQAVLEELFGAEAAAIGTEVKATFEGVERSVKAYLTSNPKLSKKGAIKENRERAEELLKARGLLRIIQGGQVKVHKREASHG